MWFTTHPAGGKSYQELWYRLFIKESAVKLFVPGRICLFGEHSDWAGGYRRFNGDLEKGYTLISGTNQGLYAEVKQHASKLIYRGTLDDGSQEDPFELPMDRDIMYEEAQKGGFYSYLAGTAFQIMTHYRVRGLEINNYRTDLPIKKGLSSSAALCVMIARAFNRIYDLKLTIRGEMEYAYQGEITTPSRCGRMDQGCAYGKRPILMTYDGDKTDVQEMHVEKDLHFVIVDLCAAKDTKEILSSLNRSYPFADNEVQKNVQTYLGKINVDLVRRAATQIEKGNAEEIGKLMIEAQVAFDKFLGPACPSQLTAPVLHQVLNYLPIQPYIWGGKGVGSQGDGTAQFIVKDESSQQAVIDHLERDLRLACLPLTITPGKRVRKALIPAAGYGTRLFPASKAVKKELFPVIDRHGKAKPVILAIVEEALSAGITEIGIVIQRDDRALFEEFFAMQPTIDHFNKLSKDHQQECRYIQEIGHRITFITQDSQDGFGHAVYCARDWINDEPFVLMLGDHLYASETDISCTAQLMQIYEAEARNVVGMKTTSADSIQSFGCIAGTWKEPESLLSVSEFYEKPDLEYAREHLQVEGLEEDTFLSVFGIYIVKPTIFNYLEEHIEHNIREKGEFQLTSCLDRMRKEEGFSGYLVKGRRFDIGTPEVYRQTLIDFRNA